MPDYDHSAKPRPPESRYEEYRALRAEGILPADIGASWRLEQAGADLHRELTEQLAEKHGLKRAEVCERITPRLVLNLACRIDELARAGLELGLRLGAVDDVQSPCMSVSPFRSISEVRNDRVENDPAHCISGPLRTDVTIDVGPLCAKIIERAGLLNCNRALLAERSRGPTVAVDDLMDTPLIETRDGGPISIRRFCAEAVERFPTAHSPEFIEDIYEIIPDPEVRVLDAVQLSLQFFARGDEQLGVELGERVPERFRHEVLDQDTLDLRFISTETKGEIVALSAIVPAGRNLLEALERCATGDLLSETEPYLGRALSGREVAERAIAERVTHDVLVQRRVAEHILFERLEPRAYAALSTDERTAIKNEIDDTLQERVARRRQHAEAAERIGGRTLLQKALESLERASYELRCFRLSKAKL